MHARGKFAWKYMKHTRWNTLSGTHSVEIYETESDADNIHSLKLPLPRWTHPLCRLLLRLTKKWVGGSFKGSLDSMYVAAKFFHLVADRICNFLFCFGQDGFKVLTVVGFLGFVASNEQQRGSLTQPHCAHHPRHSQSGSDTHSMTLNFKLRRKKKAYNLEIEYLVKP